MEKNDLKIKIDLCEQMRQLSTISRLNTSYEVIVIGENFKENLTFICLHKALYFFSESKYYVIQYLVDNLDKTITFWVLNEL